MTPQRGARSRAPGVTCCITGAFMPGGPPPDSSLRRLRVAAVSGGVSASLTTSGGVGVGISARPSRGVGGVSTATGRSPTW